MENFVREYAARSMLPHFTMPGVQSFLQLSHHLYNNPNMTNLYFEPSENSIGDNNKQNHNQYFISTAAQQLLNDSDYIIETDFNDTGPIHMLASLASLATTTATNFSNHFKRTMFNELSPAAAVVTTTPAATITTAKTITTKVLEMISNYTNLALSDKSDRIRAAAANSVSSDAFNESYANDIMDLLNMPCDDEYFNSSAAISNNNTIAEEESPLTSMYFKTAVYLLYIPIFIFALLGNGTVCYIVQSTPRMRTVTNYFIANLAVGDILMSLFCVPFSFVSIFILRYWPFGIVLCYLVNYSQAVSVLVSAYTLVAISIDRYIAIMWPLRPRITKRYAKFIIAGVWAIALATAFPIPIVSKLTAPDLWHVKCHRYICREEWPTLEHSYYYTLALFTLQFVVPLAVLIFTYTRIALAVWGKRPPGEAENSRDQRMARSKRKMIKMMVMVVIVFTICWLPFNILILLLNDEEFNLWRPLPYFWFAFHWLAMSHSCYNPIIYCYMNARFRGGFLQIIYRVPGLRRCCCLRRYLRSRNERNYEATGEMTFNFIGENGGGLLRKPKIRIRNRRCIPPATGKHVHNVHQHQKKASSEFYASESIFMCGNHSVAVVPT